MTDKKISELTEVTSPAGTDVLPIVSGGDTKKVTVTNLLAGTTSVVLSTTFSLTDDEIKVGDPVTIIAAPGIGYMLVPVLGGVMLFHVPVLYTNVGATPEALLQVGGYSAITIRGEAINSALTWGGDAVVPMAHANAQVDTDVVDDTTVFDNQPLQLAFNHALGPLTGGDPVNTLTGTILYTVMPL